MRAIATARAKRPKSNIRAMGALAQSAAVLCVGVWLAAPCCAQDNGSSEEAAPVKTPRFMWRGHPLPECSSFAITEIGVLAPVGLTPQLHGDKDPLVAGDFGYLRNVSPRKALGFVAHVELANFRSRAGLAMRRRAWIGPDQAFDFKLGAVLLGHEQDPYDFRPIGILAGVGLSVGDYLVIEAQTQTRSVSRTRSGSLSNGSTDRTFVHHLGVKLGSGLAAAGAAGAVVAGVIVIVSLF